MRLSSHCVMPFPLTFLSYVNLSCSMIIASLSKADFQRHICDVLFSVEKDLTFSVDLFRIMCFLQLAPRQSAFSRPNRPPPLSGIRQDIIQVRRKKCIGTLAKLLFRTSTPRRGWRQTPFQLTVVLILLPLRRSHRLWPRRRARRRFLSTSNSPIVRAWDECRRWVAYTGQYCFAVNFGNESTVALKSS